MTWLLAIATWAFTASAAELDRQTVMDAVDARVPQLAAAEAKIAEAEGKLLGKRGAFDPVLEGKLGRYGGKDPRDLASARLRTPFAFGGELWSAYNYGIPTNGATMFPEYDGDRETQPGGEFEFNAVLPLLEGFGMPQSRAEVLVARAQVTLAEAERDRKRIEVRLKALEAYYKWVAAGAKREIEQVLYEQTASRNRALIREVEEGTRARLDAIDNERAVLERRNALARAEQELGIAAQLLSLWYRDINGRPIVPTDDQLPTLEAALQELPTIEADEARIPIRPDIRSIDALLDAVDVDRRRALNLRRPGLDLVGEYIAPLGVEEPPKLEWFAGTELKVPLLFRKGRGAVNAANASLEQLGQFKRGEVDAARAEIRASRIAIETALQRVSFTDEAQSLASEVVTLERRRFSLGLGDVFQLLGREGNLAKARKDAVDARLDLQFALLERAAATAELGE